MRTTNLLFITDIKTLIRACYGKFSSYRIDSAGMQELTELYQYLAGSRKLVLRPLYIDFDIFQSNSI